MREIKFRVWSTASEKMKSGLYLGSNMGLNADSIVMQFTGLTDKNGKEIYEGDIVKFKTSKQDNLNEFYEKIEKVLFYRGVFSIGSGKLYEWSHENGNINSPLKWRHYIVYGANNMYMIHFEIEVIGNIYESPNLLNP